MDIYAICNWHDLYLKKLKSINKGHADINLLKLPSSIRLFKLNLSHEFPSLYLELGKENSGPLIAKILGSSHVQLSIWSFHMTLCCC